MKNIFFNAHHSPVGAFASFTLGCKGPTGGLGLEQGKPADENVCIGLQTRDGKGFQALPFFTESPDDSARYEVEQASAHKKKPPVRVIHFADKEIAREFHVATDTWRAGDLTFSIISPVCGVPDPAKSTAGEIKLATAPAVLVELTVDNSAGKIERLAFFGLQGNDPYSNMRHIGLEGGPLAGIGQGRHVAIVTTDRSVESSSSWSTIDSILEPDVPENRVFGLGRLMALFMRVAPGKKKTFRFAVCFFRDGMVTTEIDTHYWYTRYFKKIEEVGLFVLKNFGTYKKLAARANASVNRTKLSNDQKFMMAHAIRSYFGSTQFLRIGSKPFWIVNEGEYRMINTFDLTVDQLFFEMKFNPWTVRNVLDMFVDRYSYRDKIRFPGNATEYTGGLSFTHDMGVGNVLSRPGYSAYELFKLSGCPSHMTHEELVNWLCCGLVYAHLGKDRSWASKRKKIFIDAFKSMCNRDHPDPEKRSGVMKLDSSRTMGGAEITTYDSLDVSLGQARNNLYLAVKCWAVYVGLKKFFIDLKLPKLAAQAEQQAQRAADTLASKLTTEGYIPAIINENNDSKIIPAIEGLVFPMYSGCVDALDESGPYGNLISALSTHFFHILKPGVCLFDDHGWKISSTSNNSWLSKIYLCQFVARKILGMPKDDSAARSDAAHVDWLTRPQNAYWCWSDQVVNGEVKGSKYYPRGVTSILWLDE